MSLLFYHVRVLAVPLQSFYIREETKRLNFTASLYLITFMNNDSAHLTNLDQRSAVSTSPIIDLFLSLGYGH